MSKIKCEGLLMTSSTDGFQKQLQHVSLSVWTKLASLMLTILLSQSVLSHTCGCYTPTLSHALSFPLGNIALKQHWVM